MEEEQAIGAKASDASGERGVPAMEEPAPVEAAATIEEEKLPGRIGRLLKRLLRWAVGLMAVFVLGIGATWFAQVQPRTEQNQALQAQLDSALSEAATLTAELDRLGSVEQENEELRAGLEAAASRLDILSVLVDVTTAQLGVAQDDPDRVKSALKGTEAKLVGLESRLGGANAGAVQGLRERVALVLDEVDGDIFAAERDLEVLANSLLELDRELFRE